MNTLDPSNPAEDTQQINWRIDRRLALKTVWWTTALPAAFAARAQDSAAVATLLRAGGCALMLRHAQTDAGIGDPAHFQLDQCSTQRNLSEEGKAQSKRIGAWFATHQLSVSSVQSSAWCRCKDTASLAFGRFNVLPLLNSTFDSRASQAAQTERLMRRLANLRTGSFEVWVTHQVNMTSMTGEVPAMGEGFVVTLGSGSQPGRVLARTQFT